MAQQSSAEAQSGIQRHHLLHLPAEIRLIILKHVLAHEHENFRPERKQNVVWTKMKAPARLSKIPGPIEEVFLQQYDWPHAGLLLCCHQLAADTSTAITELAKCQGEHKPRRVLEIYLPEDGGRLYLTWKGPSWVPVPTRELEIDLCFDMAQWVAKGMAIVAQPQYSVRPISPDGIFFLDAFINFGPRLRKGLKWGPQRNSKTVLDRFAIKLRHEDILPSTFDPFHGQPPLSGFPPDRAGRLYFWWANNAWAIYIGGPTGVSMQTCQRVNNLEFFLQVGSKLGVRRASKAELGPVGNAWLGPEGWPFEEISP